MSQSTEIFAPNTNSPANIHKPAKPTARQWLLHIVLFSLTAVTTTIFGIIMAGPQLNPVTAPPALRGVGGTILLIPWFYVSTIVEILRYALIHREFLAQGLKFSGSLLAILTAHESGHYLFCRYYGVDATLPFFIPQPPLLWPGTFGAFIRMKSAVPSRRALFDIGLAGPLAGFIVMLPIALAGVLTVHHVPLVAGEVSSGGGGIYFNDPLLFKLIARAFQIDLANSEANSFYLAAWFGALVTALNLIPVGQLDGGHGTFAVFGRTAHQWIGRAMFVGVVAISVLGWIWHGSPAWFVFILLLAVMLRVRHPQPEQMEPLGLPRIVIAVVTLIVFVLCFLPFPITIT
jgi:membrane-associated protease RseP (regulator of RpoE activity)